MATRCNEFDKENKRKTLPVEQEIPKGMTYRAKFICAGAVGYKEGTYLLPQYALDEFAYTLKRCPVIVGHQDIVDETDMLDKAVGYVSSVDRDESGNWYADFVVFCPKTIEKIDNGSLPYVSCAYRADLSADEVKLNNVTYKREILGGEMMHLALVKNPRYNGTEIWRNSEDECLVSDGVLFNQKDNIMFGIKKNKVELDKDVLINTKIGDKTIEELVNELEAATEKVAEQEKTIEGLEAEKVDLKAKLEEAEKRLEEATATAETQAPETAPVEETQEAAPETDADLRKDLNNALTEEVKPVIVKVPNVKL